VVPYTGKFRIYEHTQEDRNKGGLLYLREVHHFQARIHGGIFGN